jgi:long-chain acyl-CoA synthetase
MAVTLIGIFLESVDRYRKPALFMRKRGHEWEGISAERALAEVESLALGLRQLGLGRGDRVALLAETRYEWTLADLAVLGLGAVTVPIYPTITTPQCRRLLEDSEPKLAIVSTSHQLEKLRAAAEGLAGIEAVLYVDPAEAAGPRERSLVSVMESGAAARAADPDAFRRLAAEVKPGDLATVIYTSGTTGEPKGAMLTHANIASNVDACLEVIDFRPSDTVLSWLPLCHILERMAGLYAPLRAGVTIAYAESSETVGANAVEVHPTVLNGVPRFFEKVYGRVMETAQVHPAPMRRLFRWALRSGTARARARFAGRAPSPWVALQAGLADRIVFAKIRERVGGRLRLCVSGSAPLSPHVMEFFFALGIPVVEGYGLTETSPVICVNRLGHERPGSVGPPVPGVEVRIGEEGEILTRGPHVMQGYWRNPEATREALRDGWFHTGDVGRLDADGYLYITDRLKDLLVLAGGKKVAPQPVEELLKRGRWVGEAVLLGDRRPFVVCLIVPDFAALEAEAARQGWAWTSRAELVSRPEVLGLFQAEVKRVNAGRAPFEQIRRFALLDHELTQEAGELTPTLKVKRRVVTERFAPLIEDLYGEHRPAAGA